MYKIGKQAPEVNNGLEPAATFCMPLDVDFIPRYTSTRAYLERLERERNKTIFKMFIALALMLGGIIVFYGFNQNRDLNISIDIDQRIEDKISKAIGKYEADKLGMIDFALESSGGLVTSTPNTRRCPLKTRSLFGLLDLHFESNPQNILQPNTMPGECFGFEGNEGRIRVKLSRAIQITAISLEHANVNLLVDARSAPRLFKVYGLQDAESVTGVELGQFEYDIAGDSLQTFQVVHSEDDNDKKDDGDKCRGKCTSEMNNKMVELRKRDEGSASIEKYVPRVFQHVELHILTNYGHPEYTCVYRFRVHGVYF